MSNYNHVGLFGRLTRDAETKTTSKGLHITSFSIAVSRTRKNKESQKWENIASFFNLQIFGKKAEGLYPYLKKGQPVIVGGHLEQRVWDKEGEKRYSTEIFVETIELAGFVGTKNKEDATAKEDNQYDFLDIPSGIDDDFDDMF